MKNGSKRKLTVENSMGKVHSTSGSLKPASDMLMSEPEIIGNIAQRTLKDKVSIDWIPISQDYDRIRNHMSRIIPGFNKLQGDLEEGFYLPNNARIADFSKLPNGRAQFSICSMPQHTVREDEFILMTIRSHDQFNTTIYGLNDRYRGIFNERRVLFMNEIDMKAHGLNSNDVVNVESNYVKIRTAYNFILVPYDIPRGNLAGYFPELNPVIPIDEYAYQSNTPISKSIVVRVKKIE